ncbi:MAG: guanylate kinase [Bacteroidales bacterium]|nr:guanylate kinase [Bacteroidales bacterium]
MKRRAIIFSAPSGSGKTTIIKRLFYQFDIFAFSISATSRQPREGERDGEDYYFLSPKEFQQRVERGDFLEWEEVYADLYYGTLKSEIDRICSEGKVVVFDVDVNGGRNIKRFFGDDALAMFIMPPSKEVLEQRLRGRGTDSEESITKRLARAEQELAQAPQFDVTVVNDNLDRAVEEAKEAINKFLQTNA